MRALEAGLPLHIMHQASPSNGLWQLRALKKTSLSLMFLGKVIRSCSWMHEACFVWLPLPRVAVSGAIFGAPELSTAAGFFPFKWELLVESGPKGGGGSRCINVQWWLGCKLLYAHTHTHTHFMSLLIDYRPSSSSVVTLSHVVGKESCENWVDGLSNPLSNPLTAASWINPWTRHIT